MSSHSKFSHWVNMKPGGQGPVWICIHALSGFIEPYRHLCGFLDSGEELWGVEAKGVDGQALPELSVSAMGADYAQGIFDSFGKRTCIVIGWSFAALIAHETVANLRARGVAALLVIIDSQKMLHKDAGGVDLHEVMSGFVEAMAREQTAEDYQSAVSPNALIDGSCMATMLEQASFVSGIQSIALLRTLFAVYLANSTALISYRVPTRRGRYSLFIRAEDQACATSVKALGWDRCFSDGITEVVCPGDHHSVLKEENARAVVDQIRGFARAFEFY
ncbi:thioesterase domain-containing protein [Pseudomonas sp. NPDC087598]|uniref:thioesterase domain-containing protein n=1 Tax=Pseudomonas sp. NPDC087598 TaxID=3364440 RepID=UPI003825C97A